MQSETRSPKTIGTRLRDERVKRGWSLTKVAETTRISERFLDLIEQDRFDEVPGAFFAKSFLRQYSRLLGLYDESIEREIDARWGSVSEPLPGQEGPRVEPMPMLLDTRPASSNSRVWISVGLLAGAMAVSAFLYAQWETWTRERPEPETARIEAPSPITPAPSQSMTSDPSAVSPDPATSATESTSPEGSGSAPASPEPASAGSSQPALPPAAPSAPAESESAVLVVLRATEKVWVQAQSDGRLVFSEVLEAGEVRRIAGATAARLVVGNAGGVEIQWNGKQIGAVGNRGQVRTIRFTTDGYTFPPRTPAPSPEGSSGTPARGTGPSQAG